MVVKAACAGLSGLLMAAVVKLLDRDQGKGSSAEERGERIISISVSSVSDHHFHHHSDHSTWAPGDRLDGGRIMPKKKKLRSSHC